MIRITQDRLKEVLECDPATGTFVWKTYRCSTGRPRVRAGSLTKSGYITIQVDGVAYRASHLVHLWVTGRLPDQFCDHENGQTSNDGWENIREATRSQNAKNRKLNVNNRLGIKGVYLFKGKFKAQIQVDGRKLHLGIFDTPQEAGDAYVAAAQKYHGRFARKIA